MKAQTKSSENQNTTKREHIDRQEIFLPYGHFAGVWPGEPNQTELWANAMNSKYKVVEPGTKIPGQDWYLSCTLEEWNDFAGHRDLAHVAIVAHIAMPDEMASKRGRRTTNVSPHDVHRICLAYRHLLNNDLYAQETEWHIKCLKEKLERAHAVIDKVIDQTSPSNPLWDDLFKARC